MKLGRLVASITGVLLVSGVVWWLVGSDEAEQPAPSQGDDSTLAPSPPQLTPGPPEPVHVARESCHDRPLGEPSVTVLAQQGAPPVVGGGQLLDGAYDVAACAVYAPEVPESLPKQFRQTIYIEQSGTISKTVRVGVTGEIETLTWQVTTAGSTMKLTGACPPGLAGMKEEVDYEMSGKLLKFKFEQAGAPVVVTYRRRP